MLRFVICTVLAATAVTGFASTKESGNSTLKDVQPAGTTDKKHKHQQYDLSFVTNGGNDYTCRTKENTKVNATDFAVGSGVTYEVKGNKGKVKTSAGKGVDCTIVRLAKASPPPTK